MIPVVSSAQAQVPAPILTSAVVGAQTEAATSGRLSINAVSANPSSATVINNRAPQTSVPSRTRSTEDSTAKSTTSTASSPQANTVNAESVGLSSPFLAQLLAQSPANSIQISVQSTAARADQSPIEVLDQFSEVRFLPSLAAKPNNVTLSNAEITAELARQQAQLQQVASAVAETATQTSQLTAARDVVVNAAVNDNAPAPAELTSTTIPAAGPAPAPSSLLLVDGTQAYGATTQRTVDAQNAREEAPVDLVS